jgi:alanine racemase
MDAKHTIGEPRLLISRSALLHNVSLIRSRLSPSTRVCAILKADAYGHGAQIVAETLCSADGDDQSTPVVDALAVASMDEAATLDNATVPIIVFRPLENAYIGRQRFRLDEAVRKQWVLTLCSVAAADDLARIAVSCGKRAPVQVMVDTGMSRSGISVEELNALLHRIDSRPSLRLVGLCTHFATAETPRDPFAIEQLRRFHSATGDYMTSAVGRVARHAASSGAIFQLPSSHLDMVRPGISLYGIDSSLAPSIDRPLRPVMKWTAPIVGINLVKRGEGVGYGRSWVASRSSRIALVPVGYADGYPRCLSNRASMLVRRQSAPVVGRISMDLTTIDVTEISDAAIGDEVTILDNDPISSASVYELARLADTIPYELLCRIGPRIGRVAVNDVPHSNVIQDRIHAAME